ncbi:2-hydroxyacid dehydrogenase [Dryocola sp. BD586]|uniref:2-hydroxyacid dehydrogenase n=1 Tax=Dryocola sp. BD586 TaxID=3133271 RepID=UPI003F4FA283
MSEIMLLVVPDNLPPYLLHQVNNYFNAVSLSDVINDEQWFKQQGRKVSAILTNGIVGASGDLINRMPGLKIIASNGVGYDAIDLVTAQQRNIVVTNTPEVLNDCVADHAMALLLDISRRLSESDRYLRSGKWLTQGKFPAGKKVSGKACAIAGLGNIGRAVARRAEAFGMQIHYFNRTARQDVPYTFHADLVSLAQAADYLVVTLPGGAATRHLINRQVLDALGPDGYVINVSRGTLLDESALVSALLDNRIAGAALDVFEHEPQVRDELIAAENVVLTPHIASATQETSKAMADLVIENLLAFSRGQPVLTPVNFFVQE